MHVWYSRREILWTNAFLLLVTSSVWFLKKANLLSILALALRNNPLLAINNPNNYAIQYSQFFSDVQCMDLHGFGLYCGRSQYSLVSWRFIVLL